MKKSVRFHNLQKIGQKFCVFGIFWPMQYVPWVNGSGSGSKPAGSRIQFFGSVTALHGLLIDAVFKLIYLKNLSQHRANLVATWLPNPCQNLMDTERLQLWEFIVVHMVHSCSSDREEYHWKKYIVGWWLQCHYTAICVHTIIHTDSTINSYLKTARRTH